MSFAPSALPSESGTYVLILQLSRKSLIAVGKLGIFDFAPGTYGYVGSAMGPGGVAARVRRHLKMEKKAHWHVDHLRPAARIKAVVTATGTRILEHIWAGRLGRSPFRGKPVQGFGCTDCKCRSHLFLFEKPPNPSLYEQRLKARWILLDSGL